MLYLQTVLIKKPGPVSQNRMDISNMSTENFNLVPRVTQPRGAEKRDPGNEVGKISYFVPRKAALVKSHMNGLQPSESTIEQTTETIPPSHKTVTAAAMRTNKFPSL